MSLGAAPDNAAAPNKWIVAVAAMLATVLEVLDVSIANVALDHMRGTFSAGVDEVTWVITSYLVANAVALPITGWLADLIGRRRLFVGATAVFTLASIAVGAAPSLPLLILARLVQGLAGGPLIPLSQAVMMETFPPRERGMAMAIWGVGIMFGPIVGPSLGGWITDNWNWRWIFYINLPIGVIAAVLAQLVLPPPAVARRAVRRIDLPGLVLLTVGIGGLQFVLDRGQREDWFASALIMRLAILSVVALALFVWRELTTSDPVVDLRVLRHRTFTISTLLMALMGFALYGAIVLSPLYTQLLMGYTALLAGLVLAPGGMATLLTMPIAGALTNRIDPRWIIGTGCGLGAFSMWQMATLTLDASFGQIVWPRFVQGLGIGLMFVPLSTVALGAVPAAELSHASGLYNLMRNIGGSVGIALMATLLERGAQAHQARLVGHVSLYNADVWTRYHGLVAFFAARGSDPATAQEQAWAALYAVVQRQALFLAFLDDFWLLAAVFLLVIPGLFLMGRSRVAHEVTGGH